MRFTKCIVIFPLCLLIGACDLYKGDLEIDIGDYEAQLEAWNRQNMLDYQIKVRYFTKSFGHSNAVITVKNGVPEINASKQWWGKSTVLDFFLSLRKLKKITGTGTRKVAATTDSRLAMTLNITIRIE
jgi:hypothetical protein